MSIHKAQVKESYEENPVSGGKGYKKNINRAIRMTGGGGLLHVEIILSQSTPSQEMFTLILN